MDDQIREPETCLRDRAGSFEKGHNWGRKGEAHHAKKLTEDDVRLIRANPDGVLAKDLAKRFGVSKAMITKIRKGMAWSHVA